MSERNPKKNEAIVRGGPYDGDYFQVWEGAESFTPAKTSNNRPVYKLVDGEWKFDGYEGQRTQHDSH